MNLAAIARNINRKAQTSKAQFNIFCHNVHFHSRAAGSEACGWWVSEFGSVWFSTCSPFDISYSRDQERFWWMRLSYPCWPLYLFWDSNWWLSSIGKNWMFHLEFQTRTSPEPLFVLRGNPIQPSMNGYVDIKPDAFRRHRSKYSCGSLWLALPLL
jgi:hypothetical protein